MGAQHQHGMLFLLLTIAAAVNWISLTVEGSSVCSANDERQECSNVDVDVGNTDCTDQVEECKIWASTGECAKNPSYMLAACRRSCNTCEYEFNSNSFGTPQLINSPYAKEVVSTSVEYMKNILANPKYNSVRDECRNNNENCSIWAMGTGCDDNPKFMKLECAPACKSCDYVLEMKTKCAMDPNGKDAIEVGEMDALFERIVRTADYANWQPSVLSRPTKQDEINEDGSYASILSCEEDITNPCSALGGGPWIITLDNFISIDEISVLKEWGAKLGYERSHAGDEVVEARTSAHAWCTGECLQDPIVSSVRQKIVRVTGIPEENYESFQLLKYTEGQYYRAHTDFIEDHTKQAHGPRLLTFFIYFNEVEKGGATRFPTLQWPEGLTVEPRQGRVLIWPSVLDRDLLSEDPQTFHEAMPVEAGEKYSANVWIHTRDFQLRLVIS